MHAQARKEPTLQIGSYPRQHHPPTVFSCGLELADLVVASDLLHRSWAAIQKDNSSCLGGDLDKPTKPPTTRSSPFSVTYRVDHQPNYTIVAFASSSSPSSTIHHQQGSYQQGGGEAARIVSPTLQHNTPIFNFLPTKDNPSISINEEAINLFLSLKESLSLFTQQLDPSTTLIITGQSLGGSVASLFTLWLLENPTSTKNLPLCITFGSPLVGNHGLRQAIFNRSWHSRFLHIVSHQDFLPRLFISQDSALDVNQVAASHTSRYKPFGTFFMCSQSGCACFEDPDSVLELMAAMGRNPGSSEGSQVVKNMDYGEILEHLKGRMFVSKGVSQLHGSSPSALRAGLGLQLEAIEVERKQQKQWNNEDDTLITTMEKRETMNQLNHKRHISEADKKFHEMKVNMAYLEWYKKVSSTEGMGYYDSYKNMQNSRDIDVIKYKKSLTRYWEDQVAEAERKPQTQGIHLQTRWLYGGTNYRRMVEPLDIAEYYKKGQKNYRTERSDHYIKLEKWQKDEEITAGHQKNEKTRNKATFITEDSCFWANVEEAIILTNLLKNGEESSWEKLKKFETDVMGLINNYVVSPEIFLQKSSFMQWWREYEMVIESMTLEDAYSSPLTLFMKNHSYQQYA